MKNSISRKGRNSWVVITALALSACASTGESDSPEKQVIARSNAFWEARLSGNVAQAYELTAPGYRAVNDLENYRLLYGAIPMLKGGEITQVKCEPERCEIIKSFTTSTPMMPKTRVPLGLKEIWIYQDGQWWLHVSER